MNLLDDLRRVISKLRGEEYLFYSNSIDGELAVGAIYEALFGRWRITRNFNHGPQPQFGPDYDIMYEIWGKPLQSSAPTPKTEERE